MIAWFYSVARIPTGVTTSDQFFLEGTKTIVDTSNRFRVVGDVVCDDFMQFGRLLGAERVPARLAAPPRVPWMVIEQPGVNSVTNVEPGIQSDTFLVAKSKGKILVTKCTLTFFKNIFFILTCATVCTSCQQMYHFHTENSPDLKRSRRVDGPSIF